MRVIKYSVWDYDFLPQGGYGWTAIKEEIFKMTMEDFICKLMNEFDIECGKGGIWENVSSYDEEGNPTMFIFHHKSTQCREYVYEIL